MPYPTRLLPGEWLHLSPEPMTNRNTEAHFAPIEVFGRKQLAQNCFSKYLVVKPQVSNVQANSPRIR
jgi:hypothetical protein